MYLRLSQIIFLFITVVIVLSQVVWPAIQGTKWWPMFNKRRTKAVTTLQAVREDLDVERIEAKIVSLKPSNKE